MLNHKELIRLSVLYLYSMILCIKKNQVVYYLLILESAPDLSLNF